ncbi:hypothetical protein EJ06DRAFT_49866 [Trichodelitschia bisporula]|uniref:Uncharacterized protein n=1 Tax=Trichodelitschia bisporula TaxID=703511 RepID=A0A6G1HTL3_9PEZI|nr:hypothetical protein EJ06DRAFT_49866 [Trichodelitschia bisporula]
MVEKAVPPDVVPVAEVCGVQTVPIFEEERVALDRPVVLDVIIKTDSIPNDVETQMPAVAAEDAEAVSAEDAEADSAEDAETDSAEDAEADSPSTAQKNPGNIADAVNASSPVESPVLTVETSPAMPQIPPAGIDTSEVKVFEETQSEASEESETKVLAAAWTPTTADPLEGVCMVRTSDGAVLFYIPAAPEPDLSLDTSDAAPAVPSVLQDASSLSLPEPVDPPSPQSLEAASLKNLNQKDAGGRSRMSRLTSAVKKLIPRKRLGNLFKRS